MAKKEVAFGSNPKHEVSFSSIAKRREEHANYDKQYYSEYHHFVPVEYGELMGKKLTEHYITEYEDISNIYLSKETPSAISEPNSPQNFLVDHYITDYWGYILSPLCLQVLIMLQRLSFKRGFTNISNSELSKRLGKSRSTVQGAIDTLEDNMFLVRFYRKSKTTGKDVPSDAGIYIRLRESVPLLSEEQVDMLPKFLQDEHAEYLKVANEKRFSEEKSMLYVSKRPFFKKFIIEKCQSEGRVERDISFIIKEHGIMAVAKDIFAVDENFDGEAKAYLEESMSKPSHDVFVKNSLFILDGESVLVVTQDQYVADGLNSGYLEKLMMSYLERLSLKVGYDVKDYNAVPFSKYYKSLKNKEMF